MNRRHFHPMNAIQKSTALTLMLFTVSLSAQNGVSSKLLIHETFDAPALPANWSAPNKKAFSIAESALRGVCAAEDHHGPAISVPIAAHDLDIEFDVKMVRPGSLLFLVDGDSQFGGQAHLLRCAFAGCRVQLAQDRGSLDSKLAQKKAADAQGGRKLKPTAEQLADPKFYRTEPLANQPGKLTSEWQHVSLRLRGQKIEAQLGDGPKLQGTATVLDLPKTRLVFLIGQSGDMRVDNVKVTAVPRNR